MVKKTVKKTTKKATRKASTSSRNARTSSRSRSSNRKVAQQENPFQQQGYPQQAAQGTQEGVYARGGKLKRRKGCRR